MLVQKSGLEGTDTHDKHVFHSNVCLLTLDEYLSLWLVNVHIYYVCAHIDHRSNNTPLQCTARTISVPNALNFHFLVSSHSEFELGLLHQLVIFHHCHSNDLP